MTEKQAELIIQQLHTIEVALFQLDKMGVFILSCLLAFVVLYAIWYCLIRFTWF